MSMDILAEAEARMRENGAGRPGEWASDAGVAAVMVEYDRLRAENVALRRVVASAQPRTVYTDVTPDVEVPIIRSADKPITRKVKRGE